MPDEPKIIVPFVSRPVASPVHTGSGPRVIQPYTTGAQMLDSGGSAVVTTTATIDDEDEADAVAEQDTEPDADAEPTKESKQRGRQKVADLPPN